MMIIPDARARKMGRKGGKYGGIRREEKGNADYGGMAQPSQHNVAPCLEGVQ